MNPAEERVRQALRVALMAGSEQLALALALALL